MANSNLPSINSINQPSKLHGSASVFAQNQASFSSISDNSTSNTRYGTPEPTRTFPPTTDHRPPVVDEYPDDIDMPVVHIPTRTVEPQVRYWRSALLGHFVGPNPDGADLQSMLATLWDAQILVRHFDDDLLLISVAHAEDCHRILAGSPWPLPGCYLILKLWEPGLTPHLADIGVVPNIVSLWELPIEYWEYETCARVLEPIGTLISIESEHSTYSNIRVLRALVLVDVRRRRRYQLNITCGRRSNIVVVTYEGNPRVCIVCGGFGHSFMRCQSGPGLRKDWSRRYGGTVNFPPSNNESEGMDVAGGRIDQWNNATAVNSEGNTLPDANNCHALREEVGPAVDLHGSASDVSLSTELMSIFRELESHLQVGMLIPDEELDVARFEEVQPMVMGSGVSELHESTNISRGGCMDTRSKECAVNENSAGLADAGIHFDDPLPPTNEIIQQMQFDVPEESRAETGVGMFADVRLSPNRAYNLEKYVSIPHTQGPLEDVIKGGDSQTVGEKFVGKLESSSLVPSSACKISLTETSMAAEEVREFTKRMEEEEIFEGIPVNVDKSLVVVLSSDSSDDNAAKGIKRKSASFSHYERSVAVSSRVRGRLRHKSPVDLLWEPRRTPFKRARFAVRKVKKSLSAPSTKLTLAPPSEGQDGA